METNSARLLFWTLLGVLSLPNIAAAGLDFTVKNTSDLRAAIEQINASFVEGSSCGVFDLANRVTLLPGIYTLAEGMPEFEVGKETDRDVCVFIQGSGGAQTTVIDGGSTEGHEGNLEDKRPYRVMSIHPRGRVALDGVTIKQGHHHSYGGGAIFNQGDLAIYNSIFTRNSTHGRGGAIFNKGNLWINESTLSDNWSKPNTVFDIDGDGKDDYVSGGAIANVGGSVLMYNATISGNFGGINPNDKTTSNSDAGGGILNMGGGVLQMNNTTVAYNKTAKGNSSGIYTDPRSTTNIWNTIIANNYGPKTGPTNDRKENINYGNCSGNKLGSFGYNLVGFDCGINDVPGDQTRVSDPMLLPLQLNGGNTPTHALQNGSTAIDAGNPDQFGNASCAVTDQRYLPRPKDGPVQGIFDGVAVCDIGAYEYGAPEYSVDDAAVREGNSGTKDMVFEVHLSYASVEAISIDYSTFNGSAKAGKDYMAASGTVGFNPGEVSKSVKVKIIGDRRKEPDETFVLNLSSGTGIVQAGDSQAVGTIKNDD